MEILKVNQKPVTEARTIAPTKSSSSSELLSNPSTELAEISEGDKPENYYYQGIGWLWGTLSETEEGFPQITLLDGNSFGFKASSKLLKIIKQQTSDAPSAPLWLRCYPNFNLQKKILSFRGVISRKERPSGVEPGIFILRGVWHRIKFNRDPVFSIYRNQLKFPRERVRNNHLPLRGFPETPFNQEKDPGQKKKFSQIEARLNSSRGCFEWVRNLASPFHPPPPKLEKTAKFTNGSTDSQTEKVK